MKKVIAFGEIMMRLNPPGYFRLVQTDTLEVSFAGGEANVAVSLSQLGMDAGFVTKVPDNEIGQAAINSLRRYGVDTKHICRGGERLGAYFLEKGASQRPSKVIYDRKHSAISTASAADFDWEAVFKDCGWFHFTGITPALGAEVAGICRQACRAAKKANCTISCDLNYRKNLWTPEQAQAAMTQLMPFADVCIANEEDAEKVFGIRAMHTDVSSGSLDKAAYEEVAASLAGRFGFRKVAITLRTSLSASDNRWAALLYDSGRAFYSKEYSIHIVDRVGGGDSFAGGLIHALMRGYEPQRAIDFAVAASCLKHTIEQDFNLVGLKEVESLAEGDSSGRVQR